MPAGCGGRSGSDAVSVLRASIRSTGARAASPTSGGPGNYYARQLHRWVGQYRASETETIPAMERLIEWLPAHVPGDDTTDAGARGLPDREHAWSTRRSRGSVAVLDWELSHASGNPLGDLGYLCTPFRMPPGIDGFRGLEPRAHGHSYRGGGRGALLPPDGSRRRFPDWEFYVAFALFRLAAICQGIMGRVRDGTASDPDARRRGSARDLLAEAAWAVVDARRIGARRRHGRVSADRLS